MVKRREFGAKRGKFTEEEDDILYVQEALLPVESEAAVDSRPPTQSKDSKRPRRVLVTGSLWAAFFAVGMCYALPGPTLPDLREWTDTNIEQISMLFPGRACGYLIGALVSGFLFDRFSQPCLLSMGLLATAIATGVIPWCFNAPLLIAAISLHGIAMGCLDTGGSMLHVHLWGKASGDTFYVQRIFMGFGAFLAPLLTQSFVYHPQEIPHLFEQHFTVKADPSRSTLTMNISDPLTTPAELENQTLLSQTTSYPLEQQTYPANNTTASGNEAESGMPGATEETFVEHFKKLSFVHYSYFITAGYCLLVSILLVVSWCQSRGKARQREEEEEENFKYQSGAEQKSKVLLLTLLFMMYLLHMGVEATMGGFITSYAITYLKWPKLQGVVLTSVFWGSVAVTRVVVMFLAKCLTPTVVISIDLVIMVLSFSCLVVIANMNNIAIWVCTAILGTGIASVYPAGLYWAERHMTPSRMDTVVFIGASALGEISMPVAAAYIFQNTNPAYIMYLMMSAAMLNLIIFILLQNMATHIKERENRRNH